MRTIKECSFRKFLPLAVLAVAALGGVVLPAQESGQAARVRTLNNSLLQLHSQAVGAGAAQAALLRTQAATVIAQREAALSALIAEDAALAISLAFPSGVVERLARAFPQSAAQLESHGAWQGAVEYIIEDDASLTVHRSIRKMRWGQQELEIHFSGPEPPGLKNGDIVSVSGIRAGNHVAAAEGSVQGSEVAPASCSSTGVQNTAVLLVYFKSQSLPSTTPQSIHDIFFDASGRSVKGYWEEASYNQTTAAGNVFGWYQLDNDYTCDDYYQIRSAAIAKADGDVDFQQYSRVFIVFPNPGGCGWAGLGTLGCGSLSSPGDGSFTASTSWQLSNYMGTRNQGVELSTHEGGHNLTLHHASSRDFGSEALGPLGSSGSLSEYGDKFSTMGSWNLGHYSAQHKVQLGWRDVGDSNVQPVQSSGSFTLEPWELDTTGLQALKVQRGTDNDAWLWVEYRQPAGDYDTSLSSQVFSGALIHYQDSTTGTRTHLLDFTPETTSWNDPALAAGTNWADPYTNVSLSVSDATSSSLRVDVNFGAVPCTPADPSVSLSPSSASTDSGQSLDFTVTVANNDSSGCSASTFDLTATMPDASWSYALGTVSLLISPGEQGQSTLTVNVPGGFTPGTYAVSATATNSADGAYQGSGSANVSVTEPTHALTVSVSGKGTVNIDPPNTDCRSTCVTEYPESSQTSVTLTASPDRNQSFLGWGGACGGTDLTCAVTMTSDLSVTASFGKNNGGGGGDKGGGGGNGGGKGGGKPTK